jgi:hypothetical protein
MPVRQVIGLKVETVLACFRMREIAVYGKDGIFSLFAQDFRQRGFPAAGKPAAQNEDFCEVSSEPMMYIPCSLIRKPAVSINWF